jgi:hypothetical protein
LLLKWCGAHVLDHLVLRSQCIEIMNFAVDTSSMITSTSIQARAASGLLMVPNVYLFNSSE